MKKNPTCENKNTCTTCGTNKTKRVNITGEKLITKKSHVGTKKSCVKMICENK